jgi:hypothetical protein
MGEERRHQQQQLVMHEKNGPTSTSQPQNKTLGIQEDFLVGKMTQFVGRKHQGHLFCTFTTSSSLGFLIFGNLFGTVQVELLLLQGKMKLFINHEKLLFHELNI